jgi:hypothetical protein
VRKMDYAYMGNEDRRGYGKEDEKEWKELE